LLQYTVSELITRYSAVDAIIQEALVPNGSLAEQVVENNCGRTG